MNNIIQYKNKMAATQREKCFVRKQEMYTLAEKKELGKSFHKYKEKQDKKPKDLKDLILILF